MCIQPRQSVRGRVRIEIIELGREGAAVTLAGDRSDPAVIITVGIREIARAPAQTRFDSGVRFLHLGVDLRIG